MCFCSRDVDYDEKRLSLIRRIDFAWAVEKDNEEKNKKQKKSSKETSTPWQWQSMVENLQLAHQELSVIIDLINTVRSARYFLHWITAFLLFLLLKNSSEKFNFLSEYMFSIMKENSLRLFGFWERSQVMYPYGTCFRQKLLWIERKLHQFNSSKDEMKFSWKSMNGNLQCQMNWQSLVHHKTSGLIWS